MSGVYTGALGSLVPSTETIYASIFVVATTVLSPKAEVSTSTSPGRSTDALVVSGVSVSNAVMALVRADDLQSVDAAMYDLQAKLRSGEYGLALELDRLARGTLDTQCGVDERGLAVETLAGAKVQALESVVVRLIRDLCSSDDEHMRVSAIAAATHLSAECKQSLRPTFTLLSTTSTTRVRRASSAFLRASSS